MNGERRKKQRQALKYPAKIDIGNGVAINCLLTEVSATGVRVAVENPEQVPEFFALLLAPEHSVMRHCKVVWRTGRLIGAEFVSSAASKAANREVASSGPTAA